MLYWVPAIASSSRIIGISSTGRELSSRGKGRVMLSIKMISRHWPSESGLVYGLRDVTFDIERGELLTVMGASGSGKSTLLHILGLLDLPSEGGYEFEGREVTALPDRELARTRNRYFGFVFQRFHLLGELTALENVMLPMGYAGIAPVRRRERAGELLGRLGLTRLLSHYPSALSGGERQRVAIARALANDPGLLLAD
jgi:putative ABC transport system ATP-binding protein